MNDEQESKTESTQEQKPTMKPYLPEGYEQELQSYLADPVLYKQEKAKRIHEQMKELYEQYYEEMKKTQPTPRRKF